MARQIIRINLRSFDSRLLDSSVSSIVDTARQTGATVAGPVPLPTRTRKFTVLRSPHVDKKSREQFEMRQHKRLIDLVEYTQKTLDELQNLELPAGVHAEIKLTQPAR
ncbi:MAG: small subunit ribosomal protein [Candidatus Sumerlaeota bacterium]|nr:small subunit ribosomal protein [Candidatus Sumerlaeota bacterium]